MARFQGKATFFIQQKILSVQEIACLIGIFPAEYKVSRILMF